MSTPGEVANAPHIMTIFRCRLRDDALANGYEELAMQLAGRAMAMPGFVGINEFAAEDGELLTVVEFDSIEHQNAWRDDPEHRLAQRRASADFYAEYRIEVCELLRKSTFPS